MGTVVNFRTAENPRDIVHEAVRLLSNEEVVGFPTESLYLLAASSLSVAAVRRIQQQVKASVSPLTLWVKGADEAIDYVPRLSKMGRKLARRCWPGPVTLLVEATVEGSLLESLPEETRRLLLVSGRLQIRSPAHPAIAETLKLLPAPLVSTPESPVGLEYATTTEKLLRIGGETALVIDDGNTRYGAPATVVRVSGQNWTVERPGVVTETMIRRLASEVFLFVCTGNTCRSPMAEAIFRNMLARKLNCSEADVVERGFIVMSAGLSAQEGQPAAKDAVELGRLLGFRLQSHASQPLNQRLLDQADHILTMTRGHRAAILESRPDLADRVRLLSPDNIDIPDPIGAGMPEYERCANTIEQHLSALLDSLSLSEEQS